MPFTFSRRSGRWRQCKTASVTRPDEELLRVMSALATDARGDVLARPKGLRYVLEAGAGLKAVLARALKCPCHKIMHSATRPVKRRFHTAADLEAN